MPRRLDRTAVFATLLVAAYASFPSAQSGGMVLVGGTILTQDASRPVVDAVAVRDGRIVAIGFAADVRRAMATAGIREIDLRGKTLIPGLIDAHVHIGVEDETTSVAQAGLQRHALQRMRWV